MTTYNTGNPLGSAAAKDLYDNAENLDHLSLDQVNETWPDRLGRSRLTWHGMEERYKTALNNLGFNPVGTFQEGSVINAAGDIVQDAATEMWYRWDDLSTLPKTVPSGSTPASTGGIEKGAWQPVDVSDVLRRNLARDDGFSLIGQVPDIETLRTIRGGDSKAILLTEYRTGCNFGGGQLFWDADSSEDDNGITIFAVTGVSTGRWKRKYDGFIDAHWAGLPLEGATASCYTQLQAIEQLMYNEHVSCYFHNGTYNIISQNMPWKNPDVPPLAYKSYGGASIICDGPGVIFKTTSVTGADVFNINGVSDLNIKGFPTITAIISTTTGAGSNGVSLTYGGKNIHADIECVDLPFTVKSDHLDGGKAVTMQPSSVGLSFDNIKINCRRARNVSYGFGADINMDWLLSKKMTAIDIFIDVDTAYRGISIGGTTPSTNNNFDMGLRVRGFTKNCQQHIVLVRGWGVDVNIHAVNTLPKVSLPVYAAYDNAFRGLQMLGCKNSKVTMNGIIQDVDTLYAIGGTTYSAGIVGNTSGCDIDLSIMYDSVSNPFDIISSNGNTIANCTVKLNNIGAINQTGVVSGNSSLVINGISVLPKVVSVGGIDVTNAVGSNVAGFTEAGYLKSAAINSTSALGTYKGKSPVYASNGTTVIGWTPYYNS